VEFERWLTGFHVMPSKLEEGADESRQQLPPAEALAQYRVLPSLRERLSRALSRLPFANTVGRTLGEQSTRAALYTFWLTRTIILVIFILTGQIKVMPDPANSGIADSYLSLRKIPVSRILSEEAQTADANWYMSIAANGYERRAFENSIYHNWAFFPLYPLLLRAASWVTGEFTLTGMLISHLFFFFALILLHKTALAFGLDVEAAGRAIFYLAIFPVSYFFSLPVTESLFLLLTTASFYFAKRERWWIAGLCGALASATRLTGVLLLPTLAVLYWQTYRHFWPPRKSLLAVCLVPAGLFAFMIYLHAITGNALAFKGALAAWGRTTGFFLMPLLRYLRHPFVIIGPWNPHFLNFWADDHACLRVGAAQTAGVRTGLLYAAIGVRRALVRAATIASALCNGGLSDFHGAGDLGTELRRRYACANRFAGALKFDDGTLCRSLLDCDVLRR
jgi:hypothetical protein